MTARFLKRIIGRVNRELVNRGAVSPRLLGYRHLRSCSPSEFQYQEIHPAAVIVAPLPLNVQSREQLSRARHITGFSFFDVPDRRVEPTFVATIPDCRVLIAESEWGDRHYAIVTRDDRLLTLRGTGYQASLHASLMSSSDGAELRWGTWILEAWDRNYAHWLQWHLAKIVQLQTLGVDPPILVPPRSGVVRSSLAMLGVVDGIEVAPGVLNVDELVVMGMDSYRPSILRDLRKRFARPSPSPPWRKVFITRRDVTRRRLLNESECSAVLEAHGFESVILERLTFTEQIATMQEARVVVGLHGAGLANILFASEGAHVLEIADETFPNPQYYALASVLGHHYWLLHARPAGDPRPGYHDLTVNVAEVDLALTSIEGMLG